VINPLIRPSIHQTRNLRRYKVFFKLINALQLLLTSVLQLEVKITGITKMARFLVCSLFVTLAFTTLLLINLVHIKITFFFKSTCIQSKRTELNIFYRLTEKTMEKSNVQARIKYQTLSYLGPL